MTYYKFTLSANLILHESLYFAVDPEYLEREMFLSGSVLTYHYQLVPLSVTKPK